MRIPEVRVSGLTVTATVLVLVLVASTVGTLYLVPRLEAGYLSSSTRDTLAIFGAVGTLATLIALLIALHQAHAALDVSRKIRDAVNDTLADYRAAFTRYAAGTAQRFLRDAEQSVQAGQWGDAASRASDLAEVLVTLNGALAALDARSRC